MVNTGQPPVRVQEGEKAQEPPSTRTLERVAALFSAPLPIPISLFAEGNGASLGGPAGRICFHTWEGFSLILDSRSLQCVFSSKPCSSIRFFEEAHLCLPPSRLRRLLSAYILYGISCYVWMKGGKRRKVKA